MRYVAEDPLFLLKFASIFNPYSAVGDNLQNGVESAQIECPLLRDLTKRNLTFDVGKEPNVSNAA